VSRQSATFGLPDDREIEVEIKAGHSDICRFDGKTLEDKDNFKLVWSVLEDEYNRAIKKGELVLDQEQDEELEARLRDLKVPTEATPLENM
jgi:maltooligosyltrehalose synthase